MRYRKLTASGDMTFGNGQLDFYRDQVELVAQSIWTRLRLWVGEWFLDTEEGTPYQQAILGHGTAETIEPAIRDRILGTLGVTEIISLDFFIDVDTRDATIICEVDTQYGQTTLSGIL